MGAAGASITCYFETKRAWIMSSPRNRTPPGTLRAYAAAYKCGHCNSRARLELTGRTWRVRALHDPSCPALRGTADAAASARRAAADAAEQTGIPVIHSSILGDQPVGEDTTCDHCRTAFPPGMEL